VSWLRRLLVPPVFDDEAQTQQAFMLHVILWALVVVPVLYVVLAVIVAPASTGRTLAEAAAGEAANAFLLLLLRRGRLALACSLQVLAFFTFFTVLAATGSGVLGPSYMLGYGLTIVIAGVLLGGRGAFAVTVAALFAGGIMAGRADPAPVTERASTAYVWGVSALLFPVSALVQNLAARTVRQALARARSSELKYRDLVAELEAKNAELERFTYTVSHDLKSPLYTLRGFLDYMDRDAQSGNISRLRSDIARSVFAADKMRRLLDDLLELSRIGRLVNPPEDVPFGEIAREAVAMARGRLAERGVAVEIGPDLPSVCGDRVRLVEVVQNLVDNAAKFMGDQPQPKVEIGARALAGEPVFFVRDNGIGVPPQHAERVFRLFEKLEPASEGTGVGLALVKRIVELHGGRVWVEPSGPEGGASFFFTLPRATSPRAS
jgi:signal transduction histidine kinase